MATTLTNGTASIVPSTVNGYMATQETRTIAHPIIGRPDDDITLRPAGPRTGRLVLVFRNEADADNARALHAGTHVWTLSDPDRPTIAMNYVVEGGQIGHVLDDETRHIWVVEIPYREVPS